MNTIPDYPFHSNRSLSFRQRLALQVGAKQNTKPAYYPYGRAAGFCGVRTAAAHGILAR